jgi:hypothetical protein
MKKLIAVPLEPTPAMIEAACAAGCEYGTPWDNAAVWDRDGGVARAGVRRDLAAAYRAAVAAWLLAGDPSE